MLLSTFVLHTFVSGLLLSLAIMDYLLALSMCEFHNPRRRRVRTCRGKWRRREAGGGGGEGRGWMKERLGRGRGWMRERGGKGSKGGRGKEQWREGGKGREEEVRGEKGRGGGGREEVERGDEGVKGD